MCTYCTVGAFCPYLENPFEEKDKKHEPLRKRRIHTIRGENRLVSNSLSSEEHLLLAKRPVNQGMSGFYYTSPSQHREGHRPRGRPPFSHKKQINDKRGRGVGRSPNRNSTRERDHQEERENEQDTSSRKHYSKHSSEMQHRSSYPRYSSPSRNSRHGEDVDSSGSDRSQSNKDSAGSPSANTDKKSSESSSNKQAMVKSHRRDAPREKQRLTQDLARQKRLLSEDIARAQRLQKEQMTNNHDVADKKENDSDSPQEHFDGSDELDKKECNSVKENELTMYEKCYGNFSAMSPGDESPAETRRNDEEPTSTATNKNKTESLFERILSKGAVKEAKQIEFVNESQLEMRSDEEKYDSELAKGSLASPASDTANSRGELNRKVKLPHFENVTDDELPTSDNEGSGLLKSFNNASSKSQVVSNRSLSDMQLQDKHSSDQSLEKVTNSCSPKDPTRDSNEDNTTCECSTQDGSIEDDTPNLFSKINGNENADCQSDHSIIKASKMAQILEEANMQCEHSLKDKGECDNEEKDSKGGISSPCYELENSIHEDEKIINKKIAHAQSDEGYYKTHSPNNDITEELESNKEIDNASLGQDTDVSNNEGMSDAEELSDLEPVTSSGKSKVKRKTRKKVKNTKGVVKTTSSPQRLSRRSKTGRRIGRPPKASKQPRQLDSDSDEQEGSDFRAESKDDAQRSKSQSPKNELCSVDGKNDENSAAIEENCFEENEITLENNEGGEIDETKYADDVDEDELSTHSLQHQDSDTEDASQDIFSLTETERQQLEEQGRRERARKDKRIAARQKRKSIEREKDKERATPPHLVSQNRFARDLPRHNWLVERLLQQKKLGEEAFKPDQNSDNPEENSDEEIIPSEELPMSVEESKFVETELSVQDKPKDNLSDSGEMKNDPPSPQRDEFQSELHRSFLRRSFPPNVPRTPPKLKPASPDNSSNTEPKPLPPTLKHKLQSKEHSSLEPIPKLKKIVPEKKNQETEEASTKEDKSSENERTTSPKENDSARKQLSPIEIFDDDDDKKKQEASEDSKKSKSSNSPVTSSSFSAEKLSSEKDESHSPKRSSFSPPKKNMPFHSPKKVVHSVSPTLPGSGKEISSHLMGPHHRAAILIPVLPMHDANGLPLPPSLGPTSPHMKPYSPRTFTPHLITHNPPFSTAGLFSGPMPPTNRYPSASCHHHFHPGMKPGPCKRDVNCPFHGSPTRGLPPSIMGLPSHHPSMQAFSPHGHEHISQILAREHREGHCPNSDCKLCRQGKESPKIRELDSQSNQEKTSPQPSKVVKPIAHVPGMRPPLMLSHLQQFGGRPSQAFSDIDSLQEEKARRSGMEPILSPRQKIDSSPERSSRDPLAPGLFPTERRSLPHHLTLSDLNRRREQDLMKGPQDLLSSIKHRPIPGEFMVPGFGTPPSGHSKPGLIHPKDSILFTSSRGQSAVLSQADKRDFSRAEERDRSGFQPDLLKSGPPRLRSLDERDALAMRTLSEQKRREEQAMRENPALLRQMSSKEGVGLPPAKLFEDRELAQSRDQGMPPLSRSAKEFDVRLMSSHGNSSILGPALRGLDDHRKMSEEERKGLNREEREQGAQRTADSETREREIREEQAMDALDRRRNLEQMREKEQEKRTMAEREGMRGLAMERDRIKNQFLRGAESEKHFKPTLGMPRERSPPFLRRDFYQDRLIDPSRPDQRLDLRAAALHDLQRRQELFRVGEMNSHRELLGRIASNHSGNKSLHPADKHFAERFSIEMARSLADSRSHSPSRGYPMSMASRQAMDRLAAAAQGKSLPHNKELDKDIPPHLRTEIEREREKERHRLSLEQIDVNRRLLQAELKEKVNPLVLNREIGPRDREKEMAALRERERLMIERERYVAFERLNAEERKRRRDAGELEGPFGLPGRHMSSPPFGRLTDERAKRMRMSNDEHIPTSSTHPPHMGSHPSNSFENKTKDDRRSSPKGPMEQRLGRPLDLDLPNKAATASMFDAMWMRERERALRAREELSRMQGKAPPSNHVSGFNSTKERPEGVAREGETRGKPDEEGVNLCSVCKRDASFLCSGCQGAWYCSAECQLSAWGKHSRDCGQSQRQ
ncbi:uncharacterized protein LOC116290474 isoform X2 [Actinia tenebrosa]|nr:uncharacterized protein LOC116290474 isoform X2 [Actinia tenebrosa]XP_031553370.1 uncharacterized protein LOC116290474 isoform X2 [Actinia tenebrosa]XP_031553371.1 uncharacterized protein LOC116290474 isoform X2 [Actinia tenebrosa]XP_031553372.1 uncharacterized protein LOC116290474 isoform X2 [Actinia tenebrosa]